MTEIFVWVAGGVGLSIVLRAGALYSGTDRLALMLVTLIGTGLALGIVELAMRARRALRFEREIAALPPTPTEADIEVASPEIRSVLRARIAGMPCAAPAPPYASYLLGLLVMIGLLGTFMGLFESLRGAREALGSSGDVAALRAALGAPMLGLSRAFGTSAAGVSASAVLGLALVIVRRSDARLAGTLANYTAGPLASLTIARRTLDALQAIALQGASLPAASEAITRGANAMSDVARDVGSALERTTMTVGDDLRTVARSVREDLQGASEASARSVAAAITPRLEAAVARVIESTAAQATATVARLDAASEARIARESAHAEALAVRDTAHAEALAARIDRAIESVVAAHRNESTELREAIARDAKSVIDTVVAGRELLVEAEADRAATIAASMSDTATTVGAQLRDLTSAVGAQLRDTTLELARSLGDTFAATERALEAHRLHATEQDAERTHRLEALIATVQTQLTESTLHTGERFDALLGKLETSSASLDGSLRAASEQLGEILLDSAATMERSSLATAEHVSGYLGKLTAVRDELRADDDARADRIAESTEARLQALAKTVSEALAASMEQVVASALAAPEAAARLIDDAAKRLTIEGQANSERDARLELLVERLDVLATAIDARGVEHTDRVAELATKMQETYDKSAAALERGGVDLSSTAELFGASVDKYREASDKWLTGLSVLRAAAERAAQGDAQDMLAAYLEQTREVFDHTLQFQRQLFNELRRVETREFAPPRLLATGTEGAEAEE